MPGALTGRLGATMSKDFSGGVLPAGFTQIPFEWLGDEGAPIAVEQFDYEGLDSIEDRARECLAAGQPIQTLIEEVAMNILLTGPPHLVERLTRRIYRVAGEEMIVRLLSLIIDADSPKFRAAAIAHEVGSTVLGGESVPETAARFGRRKQALFQEMEKVRAMIGFHIIRSNQRDAAAREKMRVSNFRHRG